MITLPGRLGRNETGRPRKLVSHRPDLSCILTINGGSSSLKFALFDRADTSIRLMSGRVERIGRPGARLVLSGFDGAKTSAEDRPVEVSGLGAAVGLLIDRLEQH